MKRFPWVTLVFVAAAAAAGCVAGLPELLEYRGPEVAGGAFWRLFTSQAVHWSARMAFADLGAVLLLGSALEMRSRRAAFLAIAWALVICGLGLHLLPPPIGRYRGASTIASALFVALALDLRDASSPGIRRAAAAGLALFFVKVIVESVAGRALFAGPMAPGVAVLPRAHLLGALGGAVGWLAAASWRARGGGAGGGR